MEEQWKPIIGWEDLYQVSNFGRVRSLDRIANRKGGFKSFHRGRVLKPLPDSEGYITVCLIARPRIIKAKVHQLVARHFLPPSDLPEVNHQDLNKANNRFDNLEWSTRKHNQEHARRAGLFNAALNPRRATKLKARDIPAILAARESGRTYENIGLEFSVGGSDIWKIVNGQSWQTEVSAFSRRATPT